jgi:hypothetical protein
MPTNNKAKRKKQLNLELYVNHFQSKKLLFMF